MLALVGLFGMGGAMHLLMGMLMVGLLGPSTFLLWAEIMMMNSLDLGFFSFVLLVLLLLLLLDLLLKELIWLLICAFLFTLPALFIQLLLHGLGVVAGYQKLDTKILQALELYI
jgi:hypothetical protein